LVSLRSAAWLWSAQATARPPLHRLVLRGNGGFSILSLYENISVFPVVSPYNQDTSFFLTLEEGLATGEVLVREQGSEGLARSREWPAHLHSAAHWRFRQPACSDQSQQASAAAPRRRNSSAGASRTASSAKDRIVPVGAPPLPLDVFCVEHGRWTGSSQFAAANTIVHPSVRESAAVDQVQTKVWESVRNGTNAKRSRLPPPAKISSENLSACHRG